MAEKPNQLPEWATDPGADVVEPPEGKKQQGWIQGEKPPAGFFNWFFRLVYLWLDWLSWLGDEIKPRSEGGINVPGGVEAGTSSTPGVLATNGIIGFGTESGGPGVEGVGFRGSPGGLFDGQGDGFTPGGGPGVVGIGDGGGVEGYGIGESPGGHFSGRGANGHPGSGPGVVGLGGGNSPGGRFEAQWGSTGDGVVGVGGGLIGAGVRGIGTSSAPGVLCEGFARLTQVENRPMLPLGGEVVFLKDVARLEWCNREGSLNLEWSHLAGRPDWVEVGEAGGPSWGSGWGPNIHGGIRFYRDSSERVWLDGQASRSNSNEDVIFVLPPMYRPVREHWVLGAQIGPSNPAALFFIRTNGEVRMARASEDSGGRVVSLSGVSFSRIT